MRAEVIQGEATTEMRRLIERGVRGQLVFLDVPYGLGVEAWDVIFDSDLVKRAAGLSFDLLHGGGSVYASCTQHILRQMMDILPYRRIVTWCKPNLPLRKGLKDWEWSTEFILAAPLGADFYFDKPEGEDARDYWRIPVENGFLNTDNFYHPCRKPVALMRRIIRATTKKGDTVIDPFAGSFSTAVACVIEGRNFIGVEQDESYCALGEARIKRAQGIPCDIPRPVRSEKVLPLFAEAVA